MKRVKDDDSLYIGCKNFYACILTEDVLAFACIEEEFDVTLNFDIELYQKTWNEGIEDIQVIVKWFLGTFTGDMVVLSDTSKLLGLRRRDAIITNFA